MHHLKPYVTSYMNTMTEEDKSAMIMGTLTAKFEIDLNGKVVFFERCGSTMSTESYPDLRNLAKRMRLTTKGRSKGARDDITEIPTYFVEIVEWEEERRELLEADARESLKSSDNLLETMRKAREAAERMRAEQKMKELHKAHGANAHNASPTKWQHGTGIMEDRLAADKLHHLSQCEEYRRTFEAAVAYRNDATWHIEPSTTAPTSKKPECRCTVTWHGITHMVGCPHKKPATEADTARWPLEHTWGIPKSVALSYEPMTREEMNSKYRGKGDK